MPEETIGGLERVEIAPWVSNFDEAAVDTAEGWTGAEFDDILEEGMSLPTEEELTVNVADGSARQSGRRVSLALPVKKADHAILAAITTNGKYVVRITPLEGDIYLVGVARGIVLRKIENRGAVFGGQPHTMIVGGTTTGPSGSTVTSSVNNA